MKKMLAALLSISLFANVLLTLAVSADDSLADSHMVKIVPMRYEEITAIVADIGLENGIVTSLGSYSIRLENPQVKLTVIVQESTNNLDWSDVDSWTFDLTTRRGHGSGEYSAKHKCYYRTKAILDVYTSNGTYIESGDVYSSSKFYYQS